MARGSLAVASMVKAGRHMKAQLFIGKSGGILKMPVPTEGLYVVDGGNPPREVLKLPLDLLSPCGISWAVFFSGQDHRLV